MYRIPKFLSLVVVLLLVNIGKPFAISADNFLPPAQADSYPQKEEILTVQNDTAVRTETDANLGVEVMQA